MWKSKSVVAMLLLAAVPSAYAQQPPNSGGQLQQIPPAPAPLRSDPDFQAPLRAPQPDAEQSGATIRVDVLHVTGQTLFSEESLIAAGGFAPGSDLNLADLRAMAARISAYYNERGYFLAQAYLPAQAVDGHAITIAVIEGQYGAITLNNESRLSDAVALRRLRGLDSGDIVADAPLQRRLLLLSDIPGVVVHSTLTPGASVGSSDLAVDLADSRPITGSIEADNGGNRYTGEYRFGGTVYFNNPTGIGDLVSLRVLASTDGLAYGRAAYQAPIGDLTLGVSYSHILYTLGREFESLDADGTADVASIFASYPLIRSRSANLYAQASLDAKWFEDRIALTNSVSERRSHVATLGIAGDTHDQLGGGGFNAFSLSVSAGELDIESPVERAADALGAQSNGAFGVARFSAARLQSVSGPLSVYGAVRGQIAFDNLDTSEKMELGGAYGVRAYPEGEAYGDQGYIATLEARLALDEWAPSIPGALQLIGFVDVGEVEYAKDPWFAGSNSAHRSGIGVGLNWAGPQGLFVNVSYAHKLGDSDVTSGPDRDGRVWFQVVKLL